MTCLFMNDPELCLYGRKSLTYPSASFFFFRDTVHKIGLNASLKIILRES